jgi:uncharacterized membrane protein
MASGLRVELSEESLAASPGGAVTTRCTVYNASRIVDEYKLEVSGVDPSWVEAPPVTNRIFPEAFETVTFNFKPPRAASVVAGDYPFTITASSADNPALTAAANGTLTIEGFVDYAFDLDSPRQVTGEVEGVYTLKVSNTGNSRLGIGFDAKEETGQLDFSFSEPQVQVPANETVRVTLTARPKAASLGAAAVYQITVGSFVVGSSAPDQGRKSTQVMFQTVPGTYEPPVLSPQSVELSGQHTQTELVLRNKAAISIVMSLQASDRAQAMAFEFVGGDRITVPERGELRVPIRITVLDRTKLSPAPAPTAFTVIATPVEPTGEPRSVQGELTLPGPADFRLRLEPELVESTVTERVQLTIENVSGRSASFAISAASKDASLTVGLGAAEVEVAARDRMSVPIDLTPNVEGVSATATGRPSGYTIRVVPVDSPSHGNEISGQYVFTPAAIAMQIVRKEIEAVAEATFDVQVENQGRGEVTVILNASDRAGACTYTFDVPRLTINGRSTATAKLTVKPPAEHKPDAKWQFDVEAKPVSPPGAIVRDSGVLIYRAATVTLALNPPERRGRRPQKVEILVTNPTTMPMKVKLAAVDRSGGLGVQLTRDAVDLPAGGTGRVPLRVVPWKRSRGSGEAALTYNVSATPISPPGEPVPIDGRYVALPARPKWFYILIALLALLVLAFTPLYTEAFYAAGWKEKRTYQLLDPSDGQMKPITVSGKHTFTGDVSCAFHRITDGKPGDIIDRCFTQGPRPEDLEKFNNQKLTPTPKS